MSIVKYCPMVGGECNQNEVEIKLQPETYFIAQPFNPIEERKRRESAIKLVLKVELERRFSEKTIRVADKEPKESIFCDVCRMIQSSAYGIADISGLNPNVILELGMMIALSKPVIILFKKDEETCH